jgi:hypothetical protein
LLEQLGYKITFVNPNPRNPPALEPTNAARAAALRSTTPDDQTNTPMQLSDTPPVSADTAPEGKSCDTALPATMKQQSLVLAPPSLACTHIPASPPPPQSECSDIVEDKGPGNALETNFVSSPIPASVSVVEDRDCNTCNANLSTSPFLSFSENVTITPTKSDVHVTGHLSTPPTREFRSICMGKVKMVFRQRTGKEVMVIDSGATSHMNPHRGSFIKYRPLPPGHYVELADKSKIRVLGIGTTLQRLRTKLVSLTEVLHVPKLHSPLLSIQAFR